MDYYINVKTPRKVTMIHGPTGNRACQPRTKRPEYGAWYGSFLDLEAARLAAVDQQLLIQYCRVCFPGYYHG